MSDHHSNNCFCGKGLRSFLGRTVTVTVNGTVFPTGILACYNEKTGIVTIFISATDVRYICCRHITFIQIGTLPAPGGG